MATSRREMFSIALHIGIAYWRQQKCFYWKSLWSVDCGDIIFNLDVRVAVFKENLISLVWVSDSVCQAQVYLSLFSIILN